MISGFDRAGKYLCLILILVGISGLLHPVPGYSVGSKAAIRPAAAKILIITEGIIGKPAEYGLTRLKSALVEKGLPFQESTDLAAADNSPCLVLGTVSGSEYIKELIGSARLNIPGKKESLAVKRISEGGKERLVIAGSDEVGLMYALLEITEQVKAGSSNDWFTAVKEAAESPLVPVRSMAVLLHSEDCEKEWYYSEEYWQNYFALLATNRWNKFNLIFSHQTSYLSPLYAFHVKVEEHPEVIAIGVSEEQRERNLKMLQYISSQAKAHGVSFTLGIWQQIAWEGKHQGSRQESMVKGLTRQNMHSYTYKALLKLLRAVPDIDTIQLRINHESGIDYDEQTEFYKDSVFKAIKDCGRPILLENRNVGLLRETIQASLDMGIPTRVSHKYWGEHMILPYHPTRIMWTYSYGDWLKYPQTYQNLYQVWSLGSHRVFVWGDPEYVRRFAPTTLFQNAAGFEICAPLSQKGYGNPPGDWRIFKNKELEYYRWEFERYWGYYSLFGRLTYNPDSSDEIWLRQIRQRFGVKAESAISQAYQSASRIIPLIQSAATADYNMHVWPEMNMGGLINFYLHLFSFDTLRMSSFLEYIDRRLEQGDSGKITPEQIAQRLIRTADKCESALAAAAANIPESNKEFWATQKDFQIISGMARYFANKIRATYKMGLYYRTSDLAVLKESIAHAAQGLKIWQKLSQTAEKIYYHDLVMGPESHGHWKDKLVFVEDDLKQLKYQEKLFTLLQDFDFGFDFGPKAFTSVTTIYTPWITNYYTIEPRFQGVYPHSYFNPQQGFGWNTDAIVHSEQPRKIPRTLWRTSNNDNLNIPSQVLFKDFIQGKGSAVFRADLPEGHYQAALVFTDMSTEPSDHGPMSVAVIERFGERPILTDTVIKKGDTLIKRFNFNMTGSRYSNFRIKLSAQEGADFILNGVTFTRIEPHIAHLPIPRALPGKAVTIKATVTLPEQILMPVKNSLSIARGTTSTIEPPDKLTGVNLFYSLDGGSSFKKKVMQQQESFIFAADISGDEVKKGTILYYIQASDSIGQTVHFPRNDRENAFSIRVSSDQAAPQFAHKPVTEWEPGKDLPIKVKVADPSGIKRVTLYYRQTRQALQYSVVNMSGDGAGNFSAVVPGYMLTKEFDFMYYFEAIDKVGNGIFYPDPDIEDPHLIVKIKR